jgi:hypothetical protein
MRVPITALEIVLEPLNRRGVFAILGRDCGQILARFAYQAVP